MVDMVHFPLKTIVLSVLLAFGGLGFFIGCTTQPGQDSQSSLEGQGSSSSPTGGSDHVFETVDCLLPGQMRRLGTHVTFVTARRPIRTTAEDCSIRGGEYTLADRADYQTSLKVWLDEAQKGDAEAQYYVGSLYEKGPTGKPDYALAAVWYQKAAEQGHAQAAMNLGRLYEQGLGVPRSSANAFQWYAKASGMGESGLSMLMDVGASHRIQELEQTLGEREKEILELREHIQHITKELTQLREELQQKSSESQSEGQKLQSLQDRYNKMQNEVEAKRTQQRRTQQELDELKGLLAKETSASKSQRQRVEELERVLAESQNNGMREQMEQELQAIQAKLEQQQVVVHERNTEVKHLQQQIALLEEKVADRSEELQKVPSVDLGFEGPAIEIIDPPLALTRGISVTEDVPNISVAVGVSRRISGRVLAPAGLRTFTMNGKSVQVDDQGIFMMDFPPLHNAQATHPVQILAVDIQNKRTAKKFMLVAGGKTEVAGPVMSDEDMAVFGNYYALIIGIDRYQHWNPLHNAVSDAQAVADVLTHRYGFQVTFLKDATRRDILKALNNFRKTLKENDNLLVYYAGHGHLQADIDRGYWIPVDAEIDDTSQWILTPSITDLLELMSAKHILVVADSCFAGKMTRSGLAKLRPGLSEEARMKMLKTVAKKRVRTALTSGGEHPVLDVGEGGHSVFTGALLDVLAENRTILETERLFLAIRTRVVNAADQYNMEQVPTYWPIQFAGHESLGDFIFIPHQS